MGKKVLITGASRGIGRALAAELTARGDTVVATARNLARLEALEADLGCRVIVCDLADAEAVAGLYAAARELAGDLDVLVNNAGFNERKARLAETTPAEFEAQYAVNLRAPYLLCREALRHMGDRGSGHIVNVLSTVCRTTAATMGVYSAMKYGLMGLTGAMIKEAAETGVKVTGVYPGGTDTEFRTARRPDYMRAESAAWMIAQAIHAPADVVVHELVYRPLVETNF